jgi:hypothetical protein
VSTTDGSAAGTAIIAANTESLPQVAAHWRAVLPAIPAAPPVPVYADPASAAAAAATKDWPAIQAARSAELRASADRFVAAVDATSTAFTGADRAGAGTITNAVGGPTLV